MGFRKGGRISNLTCFIQSLQGSRVVVELKYDTIIRGILTSVDDHSNLLLENVFSQPLQGAKQRIAVLFVKSRHIRYIHLASNLDPFELVENHRRHAAHVLREHTIEQQRSLAKVQKGIMPIAE